jgi:hypothetical protein
MTRMATPEPPRPQRGATAEERGPDTSTAEEQVAEAQSFPSRLAAAARPGFLLSQADGYPPGVKQFLQFCLLLLYLPWLVGLFIALLVYLPLQRIVKLGELLLMALFWPVRAAYKKRDPEGYAKSQAEIKAKAEAKRRR